MPDRHTLLAAALAYAGGSYTVADVEAMLAAGDAQLWEGPNSIIVTQIEVTPRRNVCVVFLAAGVQAEILAMHTVLEQWAATHGCTAARFVGRKGWERTLRDHGWQNTDLIIMERAINVVGIGREGEAVGNSNPIRANRPRRTDRTMAPRDDGRGAGGGEQPFPAAGAGHRRDDGGSKPVYEPVSAAGHRPDEPAV